MIKIEIQDFEIKNLPNVITPNGDRKNDYWKIENLDQVMNNELRVFNRWGELVYETVNYKNNWAGSGLSSGVYYYTFTDITCKNDIKGTITIIH